ncbi:MAG: hypothetical protein LW650_13745 [Planctomycetaceae bacterium]|jgi:hypothetical protein|nr:hypothetical protein [Phycisphaerales bacterium]MCE2654464.1 hypothetical protein [Planctomycetaceae bacterium]
MRTAPMMAALMCVFGAAASASGQSVTPFYADAYTATDLGTIAGVPTPLGGLWIDADQPGVMLIGGAANQGAGAIYRVQLVRDGQNRVTGFTGTPTLVSTAPNIDGGLARGPGGVLFFTQFPQNAVGQIKPGSTTPDRIVPLTPLGLPGSTGSLIFTPPGFPGAGSLRIVSYSSGRWATAQLTEAGDGTYLISGLTQDPAVNLQGQPEGVVYVPRCSALFGQNSLAVSEYGAGLISTYVVDSAGNPVISTRRVMVTGVSGAEGAAVDPLTGDYLFSTFGGGNRVIRVSGFARPQVCVADVVGIGGVPGGDGCVTGDDYIAFINAFSAGDLLADVVGIGGERPGDGLLTGDDFIAFINAFAGGC